MIARVDGLDQKAGQVCSVSTLSKFGACSVARWGRGGYLLSDGDMQIAAEGDEGGLRAGPVRACPSTRQSFLARTSRSLNRPPALRSNSLSNGERLREPHLHATWVTCFSFQRSGSHWSSWLIGVVGRLLSSWVR